MGYTKRPGSDVPARLLKTTEGLERLGDLTPEPPDLDQKTKKEYRKKSEPLVQNIATVDQVTAKDVKPMQDHLHMSALGLQDPLQAAYFERIREQHAESLELIAQGKPAITELDDKHLRTLYALSQDSISFEEGHMWRLIEPLMTPPQREKYRSVRQADYSMHRADPSFSEVAKLGGEVLSPFLLPASIIPIGKAIGMSGHPLTIAIAVTATLGMMGAEYMQRHAAATRSSALYGVNIYEDPNAGNDLLRLQKRAEETAKLPAKDRTPERLEGDLAMFEEILTLRKEVRGGKDDASVIALFEAHAADLKAALAATGGGGRAPSDFAPKERAFLGELSKLNLEELSAEIRPKGRLSEDEFKRGMNVVVDALSKDMLRQANPALETLVGRLDAEYGISAALAKGEKVSELPEHELKAIRLVISKQPNFPETLGLGPLAISGALDIAKVWPEKQIKVSEQESLDLRALLKDIEKMRFGNEGDRLQLLGKIVDHGSQAISIGAMSLVLLIGGGFFSIPAAIIPRMLGVIAGNKLKHEGLKQAAAQGVDLAKGRPMQNEFEVLFDRYRNPGALLAGDANAVKKQVGEELLLIQSMMKSVQFEVAQYDAQGQQTWLRFRQPVYQALAAFGNEIGAMLETNADAATLRASFQTARAKLFAPDVLRNVNQQLIREAAYADPDADSFVKYAKSKAGMIDLVSNIVASRTGSFGEVVAGWEKNGVHNTEIFKQAIELRDLRQAVDAERSKGLLNWLKKKLHMYKGMEIDAVDKLAMSIIEERFKRSSLSAILDVTRAADGIATKLNAELQERWPVDADRAKEIAAELVGAVMNRTMAVVGPWTYENAPDVKLETEVRTLVENPPTFAVTGTLSGGRGEQGSISVTVNAHGICDPASIKIDLGQALLARVAVHAVESSAAIGQVAADAKKPELIGRPEKDGDDYLFRVRTNSGAVTVAVTPDGFARLDTISNAA